MKQCRLKVNADRFEYFRWLESARALFDDAEEAAAVFGPVCPHLRHDGACGFARQCASKDDLIGVLREAEMKAAGAEVEKENRIAANRAAHRRWSLAEAGPLAQKLAEAALGDVQGRQRAEERQRRKMGRIT
jgi:hypothetical protein